MIYKMLFDRPLFPQRIREAALIADSCFVKVGDYILDAGRELYEMFKADPFKAVGTVAMLGTLLCAALVILMFYVFAYLVFWPFGVFVTLLPLSSLAFRK